MVSHCFFNEISFSLASPQAWWLMNHHYQVLCQIF